jgi:pimeloyl-ACP methyl ester carboxylesterase
LRAIVDAMGNESGPDAFIRQQTAVMDRPNSQPDLQNVKCPTLVVAGDGDAINPPNLSEEIATAIPGSRFEAVKLCGHLSTLEQPDAVTRLLMRFLAE